MSRLTAADLKQLPSGVMRLKPFGSPIQNKAKAWSFQCDEFLFVVNENNWSIQLSAERSDRGLLLPARSVFMFYESKFVCFSAEGGAAGDWDYENARQIIDRANQAVWRAVREKEGCRPHSDIANNSNGD